MAWIARNETLVVGLVATLLLGVLAPISGVWEPWEADRASALAHMRTHGAWLEVGLPGANGQINRISDLPFGLWPLLASTGLLGVNELGLRLPGVLMGVAVVLLTFVTTRRLFGRLPAAFAALGLLAMPLFGLHARFAIGASMETGFIAIAALSFIRVGADAAASPRWSWLAWAATAGAGLVAGVPGLGVALMALLAVLLTPRGAESAAPAGGEGLGLKRLFPPVVVVLVVAIVAVGWWRAAVHRPEGTTLNPLLLWTEGLEADPKAVRPAFHLFFHQLGFGLFPFGAFIPLAFAELLWRPRPAPVSGAPAPATDPNLALGPAVIALAAVFASAFLAPALALPYAHFGWFLGAPAVAIAVGVYFARVLREPPDPLRVVVAVLLVALVDSNLKHETHFLADVVVSGTVGAFPPELPGWKLARLLNMGLLALLILYQGGLLRWLSQPVRWLLYPQQKIRLMTVAPSRSWICLLLAAGIVAPVLARPPGALERLLLAKAWGGVLPSWRVAIFALVGIAVIHVVLWALWSLRHKRLAGRSGGKLLDLVERALEGLAPRRVALALGLGVVALWAVFVDVVAASALTDNFSQKGLIAHYERLAQGDEPLFKHRLDARNSSFYAADLADLDPAAFRIKAKAPERIFALMPRADLARVNAEFRTATGRTLPVLDDSSFRVLLVSNQLRAGEEDRNPITRALIPALPPDANPVAVSFGDDIDLVGWKLDPVEPRPGSPLEIHLFWKAKKKITGTWQVFVHLDAAGQRIHGDHHPVEGLYPTQNWAEGDLVQDTHRVVVARSISAAWFTFYVGLYRGGERKPITSGNKDRENRANIGRFRVR
jgi:4-amino-4-deoxy-L-arabinose transferase-like glycosyltransferase